MGQALLVIGSLVSYCSIGAAIGTYISRTSSVGDQTDRELGGVFCGILWPIALPVVISMRTTNRYLDRPRKLELPKAVVHR